MFIYNITLINVVGLKGRSYDYKAGIVTLTLLFPEKDRGSGRMAEVIFDSKNDVATMN